MAEAIRQHTLSIRVGGQDEWDTRSSGEVLPVLDPFGDIPIEAEVVNHRIKALRDFFIEQGSGRPGCGLAMGAPEARISVHGLVKDGQEIVYVQTDELIDNELDDNSIQHRFYLYPNYVGVRMDVRFSLSFFFRLPGEPDVAMSEIVINQNFVTQKDLVHLDYVKSALASKA